MERNRELRCYRIGDRPSRRSVVLGPRTNLRADEVFIVPRSTNLFHIGGTRNSLCSGTRLVSGPL